MTPWLLMFVGNRIRNVITSVVLSPYFTTELSSVFLSSLVTLVTCVWKCRLCCLDLKSLSCVLCRLPHMCVGLPRVFQRTVTVESHRTVLLSRVRLLNTCPYLLTFDCSGFGLRINLSARFCWTFSIPYRNEYSSLPDPLFLYLHNSPLSNFYLTLFQSDHFFVLIILGQFTLH